MGTAKIGRRGFQVWLRAALQPATLFGLMTIAACWAAVTVLISIERGKTLEAAVQQSESLVRLFAENTEQTLLGIDRTLLLLRKGFEDDPDHFDLRNWAERTALIGDLTIQINMVGADRYLGPTTTHYSGPPLYLGDRKHVRVHVDSVTDELYISEPVLGRVSGRWTIQLSRRIRGPDGGFGGVIIASLDTDFIQKFYDTVDLGSHGNIILRNLDGVFLSARGGFDPVLARQVLPPVLRAALARAPAGHVWGNGQIDGTNRLVGYRASKIFPFIATVGRAEGDILATYLQDRNTYLAAAALITILVLIAVAGGAHYKIRLDDVQREIVHVAHHDILTGVANRMLLHDHIDQAFARARRHQERFAILCLDLDRFKIANDTLGHQAGDLLLRQVAERLRLCIRDVDTVARIGGDEFVVVQANVTGSADVTTLAERILQAVSAPYDVNGNPAVISASIGIALAPFDGATKDNLLEHADLALYRAKANGRNDFCFFDIEMARTALKRSRIELELRDALARDEFELWYQPWLDVASGRIVGCEALLRWRHPLRGLLSPIEFIPIAEESGLIGRLGDWVLRRATRDAAGWPQDIKLAINLSAAQFIGGNLCETVLDALAQSGFEATRLELEITETLIIEDYEGTREALSQLRRHGISIALDDFGTGYSSLTHLRQLLFNRIKIDKSFIAELTTRADCVAIVSAVIGLGRSLGVSITAEGVETPDQLTILRAAGCTEVQGYLFSRPNQEAVIREMLSAGVVDVIAA